MAPEAPVRALLILGWAVSGFRAVRAENTRKTRPRTESDPSSPRPDPNLDPWAWLGAWGAATGQECD